jgi:hypothetical protein
MYIVAPAEVTGGALMFRTDTAGDTREEPISFDLLNDTELPLLPTSEGRHYGSTDDEIHGYLNTIAFGSCVRILDPLALQGPRTLNISNNGQLLIPENSNGHWKGTCIDFDHCQVATVGFRSQELMTRRVLDILGVTLAALVNTFTDVSPITGSQTESECGARVAVYCAWYAITSIML